MSRLPVKRTGRPDGFALIELVMAAVILSLVAGGIYGVTIRTRRAAEATQDLIDVQHSVRSGLDLLQKDLRTVGSGINRQTAVPIETASEFRVTFVIDRDADGAIESGERITYFLDTNLSGPIVGTTPNPDDLILRRVVSSAGDPTAAPVSGHGQIVVQGVTQRLALGSPRSRIFDYFDAAGASLVGSGNDPADPAFGKTVPNASLGKPAGTGIPILVRNLGLDLIVQSGSPNRAGDFQAVRLSAEVAPRNLGGVF